MSRMNSGMSLKKMDYMDWYFEQIWSIYGLYGAHMDYMEQLTSITPLDMIEIVFGLLATQFPCGYSCSELWYIFQHLLNFQFSLCSTQTVLFSGHLLLNMFISDQHSRIFQNQNSHWQLRLPELKSQQESAFAKNCKFWMNWIGIDLVALNKTDRLYSSHR